MKTTLKKIDRWMGDSFIRFAAVIVAITAVVSAAILLPIWMTGGLDKPICPKGKTLIMMRVGNVNVPECM